MGARLRVPGPMSTAAQARAMNASGGMSTHRRLAGPAKFNKGRVRARDR